jgi:hypothetical protein
VLSQSLGEAGEIFLMCDQGVAEKVRTLGGCSLGPANSLDMHADRPGVVFLPNGNRARGGAAVHLDSPPPRLSLAHPFGFNATVGMFLIHL